MEHFLESWGYVAIFVLSLISSVGLPVGAEPALIYGGVLASGQVPGEVHPLDLALVIVVATVAEVIGSLFGYSIGLFGGRPLINRAGRYVLLTHGDIDRAEAWFLRRGEPLVLFGRLIPLLRSVVSLAAGLSQMAVARFLMFTSIGCALWCTALACLGYGLGASYRHLLNAFSAGSVVVAVILVIMVAVAFVHRLRHVRSERTR
jgi:membrane protein DedA with SNARE-associated domain